MLWIIVAGLIAFAGGYLTKRQLGLGGKLGSLVDALKNQKPIAFLESDQAIYFKKIAEMVQNAAITDDEEVIIYPRSSAKPCPDFGGTIIGVGDLYKGMVVPTAIKEFFIERIKQGWSEEDISQFLKDFEQLEKQDLFEKWDIEEEILDKNVDEIDLDEEEEGKVQKIKDLADRIGMEPGKFLRRIKKIKGPEKKEKIEVYRGLDSTVKDFIQTGINRTNIRDLIANLTRQRKLEEIGGRDWGKIAFAVLLIMVGVAIFLMFGLGPISEFLGSTGGGGGGGKSGQVAPGILAPLILKTKEKIK